MGWVGRWRRVRVQRVRACVRACVWLGGGGSVCLQRARTPHSLHTSGPLRDSTHHVHHRVYVCLAPGTDHTTQVGWRAPLASCKQQGATQRARPLPSSTPLQAAQRGDDTSLHTQPPPHIHAPLPVLCVQAGATTVVNATHAASSSGKLAVTHVVSHLDVVRLLAANKAALGGAAEQR